MIDELEQVYGANVVREGGLRVYTTIEPRLQYDANAAIHQTLNEPTTRPRRSSRSQPGTGAIRAMTAVIPGNKHNQFNLAAQSARQAGSTFKTFVLAAAIEQGIDPDTTYYTSAPFTCTTGPWCEGDYKAGKPWTVSTYDHTYAGTISVTSATLRSDNTVYAQLTLDVGPDYVWRMAKRLGVHLTQKPVASIGLGSLSVSPLDMAAAYATFAAGGIYAKPTAIREGHPPERQGRQDRRLGEAADEARPLGRRRLEGEPGARRRTRCTARAPARATASTRTPARPGRPTDHADAWFDGYTRDFSTVVWMGYPRGEIPMLDVHGQEVAGATFPVPIWHLYMAAAEASLPARQFLTPKTYPSFEPFTRGYWGYLAVQTYAPTHRDDHRDDRLDGAGRRRSDQSGRPSRPQRGIH